MTNRFTNISMNGRMAYVIMCVEAFLIVKYPQKDWRLIAERMWEATENNWGEWPDKYCAILPDVLLKYETYEKDELGEELSESEFNQLRNVYDGITEGVEDSSDEVTCILNKPFEMAMVYEGATIGDGKESLRIIEITEAILMKNHILLPDYQKVRFSTALERHGWGNDFDGRYLSVILNK